MYSSRSRIGIGRIVPPRLPRAKESCARHLRGGPRGSPGGGGSSWRSVGGRSEREVVEEGRREAESATAHRGGFDLDRPDVVIIIHLVALAEPPVDLA